MKCVTKAVLSLARRTKVLIHFNVDWNYRDNFGIDYHHNYLESHNKDPHVMGF